MRYFLAIWVILFFSACGIFSSAPERPHRPKPKPKKPKVEEKKPEIPAEDDTKPDGKVDDVNQRLDSLSNLPDEDIPEFRKKDMYSLQLILPLVPMDEGGLIQEKDNGDQSEQEEETEMLLPFNEHFIDYLSGFKLAMQNARKTYPEFNYRLHVKSSGDFDALITEPNSWTLSPEPDIILGGIRPESVDQLTSLSAQHNIYYISPWITSTPFSENPLFLQLTPGLNEYCNLIAEHVARDSSAPILTLVTSPEFSGRLKIFTDYLDENHPFFPYQTWVIDDFQKENKEPVALPNWMETDAPQALVLAMDRDESYLFDALSYFSNHSDWQGDIYGFSSWRNYPLLHEFFENGNIHLVSHTLPFHTDSAYQQFEDAYFDAYAGLPTSWAAKGYDHGMFIATGLTYFGLDFYAYLDQISYEGIQLLYKFPSQQDEHIEGLPLLPLKNQGVKLLHYEEHIFRPENE